MSDEETPREWARRVLAEARERLTPERVDEMRAQVGLPPRERPGQ